MTSMTATYATHPYIVPLDSKDPAATAASPLCCSSWGSMPRRRKTGAAYADEYRSKHRSISPPNSLARHKVYPVGNTPHIVPLYSKDPATTAASPLCCSKLGLEAKTNGNRSGISMDTNPYRHQTLLPGTMCALLNGGGADANASSGCEDTLLLRLTRHGLRLDSVTPSYNGKQMAR